MINAACKCSSMPWTQDRHFFAIIFIYVICNIHYRNPLFLIPLFQFSNPQSRIIRKSTSNAKIQIKSITLTLFFIILRRWLEGNLLYTTRLSSVRSGFNGDDLSGEKIYMCVKEGRLHTRCLKKATCFSFRKRATLGRVASNLLE